VAGVHDKVWGFTIPMYGSFNIYQRQIS